MSTLNLWKDFVTKLTLERLCNKADWEDFVTKLTLE